MFGTKSKFNLDKVKTKAIRLGLAETSTSDAELEQLCLNALDAQAAEGDDDEEEEFYKKQSKGKKTVEKSVKKPVKTKTTETEDDDDSDDDDSDDDSDVEQSSAPSWFRNFEKAIDKRFGKLESNVTTLAKRPKAAASDTKRETPSTTGGKRSVDNAPYYLRNPKNKKQLATWLAAEGDTDEDDD